MTINADISSEIQKLAPSAVIELFELDLTTVGGSIQRFHAGTNELNSDIVWDGDTYTRYPIDASGFELVQGGQFPRPKMRASNIFGTITALLLVYSDLIGVKVTRIRTLKKYLDAVNFTGGVNPTADNTAEFPRDYYYIDRKTAENREYVEFELVSSIDLHGVQLPRRIIMANLCTWVYRSTECGYAGSSYYRADDSPASTLADDVCGKRYSSCQLRFGVFGNIRFGGFPSAGQS